MKIRNDFSFTNLDKYDFYYIIRDHGKEVYRGKIEISMPHRARR